MSDRRTWISDKAEDVVLACAEYKFTAKCMKRILHVTFGIDRSIGWIYSMLHAYDVYLRKERNGESATSRRQIAALEAKIMRQYPNRKRPAA